MLGTKRDREGCRRVSENIERKVVTTLEDGKIVTVVEEESTARQIEEQYRERESLLSIEQATLESIPKWREKEQDATKVRQMVAQDPGVIRYRFRWIELDILKSKTPLPICSPLEMEQKGWSVIMGPELVWIPLYWKATRRTKVTLPDLIWISDFQFRETEQQLWVCCDFQWPDDGRQLQDAWIPELLLRTHEPYVPMLDEAANTEMNKVYDGVEHAAKKRIGFLEHPGLVVATPAVSASGSLPLPLSLPPPSRSLIPNRARLEAQFDSPHLFPEELETLRNELQNVMVPKIRHHLDQLSLLDQVLFLGDPSLVVIRYYLLALMEEGEERPLPRIEKTGLIQGDKIRCLVAGLGEEHLVWLPAILVFLCHRACKCVPGLSCACRWRAIEVAYDALADFVCVG